MRKQSTVIGAVFGLRALAALPLLCDCVPTQIHMPQGPVVKADQPKREQESRDPVHAQEIGNSNLRQADESPEQPERTAQAPNPKAEGKEPQKEFIQATKASQEELEANRKAWIEEKKKRSEAQKANAEEVAVLPGLQWVKK